VHRPAQTVAQAVDKTPSVPFIFDDSAGGGVHGSTGPAGADILDPGRLRTSDKFIDLKISGWIVPSSNVRVKSLQ